MRNTYEVESRNVYRNHHLDVEGHGENGGFILQSIIMKIAEVWIGGIKMEWEVKNEIDYSPKGDDIDTFSLKVKAEIEIIYKLLNKLRGLESTTGLNSKDTTA